MTNDVDYLASPSGQQASQLLDAVVAAMARDKVSQSELGRRTGYTSSYISMLVNRKVPIQLPTALHLAHSLKLIRIIDEDE